MSENNQSMTVSDDGYGLGTETTLNIPRGTLGLPSLQFDMSEIYRVVSRTKEVERVNVANYAMLVSEYNMGMIQINRLIGLVELELNEAQATHETVRAIAMLEKVDAYLAAKQIKSTADVREAAVMLDLDVQKARRNADALKAIKIYVAGLKESLVRAYFSAQHATEIAKNDPYLNKTTGTGFGEYHGR
jgi:hypothetical protein